ncbi:MAG: S-(hydroxymethyl)glutathione dehydrogenase/alcohol dehydrogenase [Gammaproteobacteria bacterium]|jgi:S-(hydroxymethyl)glutathione dehydrogenase/alcohol dehydrogenase
MKTKAAVLYQPNTPMVIEELDLQEPADGEVLVKITAAGVCHSDYHVMKGEWGSPLPVVLGHEGAGIVEGIGTGVKNVKVGDHVILNFRPNCGWCGHCVRGQPVLCNGSESPRYEMFSGGSRLSLNGETIHHFARTSCFSEYAVVQESGAVPVRHDMPLDKAALIGCSVMTGVGAVINTAKVEPGSSVVVLGCGGVGLNCVQGALLAGADRIIAVDIKQNKLDYAIEFGATDVINSSNQDPVEMVHELTKGGADYAFEALGRSQTIGQAYDCVRPGGKAVVVGMAPEGDSVPIDALSLPRLEKTLMGSYYGSARPWIDLPRLVDLYLSKRLRVDELVTRTYPLAEINVAYDALAQGDVARSIIVFD